MKDRIVVFCGIAALAFGGARADERVYSFGMISDTHFTGPEFYADGKGFGRKAGYCELWETNETANLRRAAAVCGEEPAAGFIVHTGDMIDGRCGNLARQAAQLEAGWRKTRGAFPKDVPFIPANGNHETYDFEAPGTYAYPAYERTIQRYAAAELGRAGAVERHYSFRRGPDLFVVYNSNVDEYDFVKRTFEENPKARYVFLIGHIPTINPCVGGIEIDSPEAGNFMENHNRFLRLLQSRDTILLCGDTHRLGMVDYLTGEGRLTELMGVSVCDNGPYREIATTPAEFPINWRAPYVPGGPISPRQKFLKGGLVRFWGAVGAGFWKLHVSDASVVADFHAWGVEGVSRTICLRSRGEAAYTVKIRVERPLVPGINRIPVEVDRAMRDISGRPTWTVEIPEGWTAAPFEPFAEGGDCLTVTLPDRPMPAREEKEIRLFASTERGHVIANGDVHFLQQDDFAAQADERVLRLGEKDIALHLADLETVPKDFADEGALWARRNLLELFFDVTHARATALDGRAAQLVVMRAEGGGYRVFSIRDAGRTRTWFDLPETGAELSIPWSRIAPTDGPAFVPAAGSVIGMDASFANRPVMGSPRKIHDDPSRWGRVCISSVR